MRIAVVQSDPKLADRAHNLALLERGIAEAAADLVVFPECHLSGYGYDSLADGQRQAETLPGPATEAVAAACRRAGAHALFGLLERDGDRLFNSAALVGPKGLVGRYRKMHLPFIGIDRFATPGDLGFPVFDVAGARVGALICFDFSFPEAARCQKLAGAQVVCVLTNWPLAAEVSCVHAPPVRAQENHVHVVTADRCGVEAGFQFRGQSRILDCDAKLLAEAGAEPAVIRAEIDPSAADRNRVVIVPGRYEIDRVGSRRPEFYGELARPALGASSEAV